ncbi:MAG: MiaB/RimO family radical SAM methylthiotransferase [Elusimicrobia bacterium]|nr:MiaB/RimO family radical SAM methylthiotransferase [Elusimicrobiota bacterium]
MLFPKKLHIVSFGCQMSAADGDELAQPLLERGLETVDDLGHADAVIVNTCTVRQHAEDRAISYIGRLREWKEQRPEGLVVVAGCVAERIGARIRRQFPFVDLVVGAKSIDRYPELLEEALRRRFDWKKENRGAWPKAGPARLATKSRSLPPRSFSSGGVSGRYQRPDAAAVPEAYQADGAPVSAYLTIMRGCNYACTYCIVPAVRGRELYRPFGTILEEARRLAASGARELMLLGQTVNSYREGGRDFADLLRAVAAVEGIERIRFMSPHPHYLTARMIEAMARTPAVCPHLHLPVQSGSDRILRRMRRNYTVRQFLDRVDALRAAVAGIEITTDFIAGFPGETEAEFEASLDLVRRLDPAATFCFKFSARDGTEAASFDGRIPEAVIERRHQRLLQLAESRRQAHLEAQVGRTVRVLLEDGRHGHTEHYVNARLEKAARPGTIVAAAVVSTAATGLRCRCA